MGKAYATNRDICEHYVDALVYAREPQIYRFQSYVHGMGSQVVWKRLGLIAILSTIEEGVLPCSSAYWSRWTGLLEQSTRCQ